MQSEMATSANCTVKDHRKNSPVQYASVMIFLIYCNTILALIEIHLCHQSLTYDTHPAHVCPTYYDLAQIKSSLKRRYTGNPLLFCCRNVQVLHDYAHKLRSWHLFCEKHWHPRLAMSSLQTCHLTRLWRFLPILFVNPTSPLHLNKGRLS